MRTEASGGVLIATLYLFIGFFWLALLVVNMGQAGLTVQRAQTVADASVLSSVRLRAEALEKISQRWLEYGRMFGPASNEGVVQLPAVDWKLVERKANDLAAALPGYGGRTTAVIKVVAEANGISRDEVNVLDDVAARIGLSPQTATLEDEQGLQKRQTAVWIKRIWKTNSGTGNPSETAVHRVSLQVPAVIGLSVGGAPLAWSVEREARATLIWDVDKTDSRVRSKGNGGYPRSWNEALAAGRLDPNRWSMYRAQLIAFGGPE